MGWNAVISNYCLKVDACNVLVSRACQKAQITLESFDEMIKDVYVVYVQLWTDPNLSPNLNPNHYISFVQ